MDNIDKQLVKDLLGQWHHETYNLSGGFERHVCYKELVKLGPSIIPTIFELYHVPSIPISLLLRKIAPNQPILPEKDRGKIDKIRKMWLDWYKREYPQ